MEDLNQNVHIGARIESPNRHKEKSNQRSYDFIFSSNWKDWFSKKKANVTRKREAG
jgi:hypothetical protein